MNSFTFDLKSVEIDGKKVIEKFGLEGSGRVQQIIDSECLRMMDPYIPFDTGALRDSGILNTQIGSGQVRYRTVYARKLYYHPEYKFEGKGDSESGGRGRGAYWFERMKSDGGKEKLLNAARKAVKEK